MKSVEVVASLTFVEQNPLPGKGFTHEIMDGMSDRTDVYSPFCLC